MIQGLQGYFSLFRSYIFKCSGAILVKQHLNGTYHFTQVLRSHVRVNSPPH